MLTYHKNKALWLRVALRITTKGEEQGYNTERPRLQSRVQKGQVELLWALQCLMKGGKDGEEKTSFPGHKELRL